MSIHQSQPTQLFIDEPPLLVFPKLATLIGLNESIILQQLHYWLRNPKAGTYHEGRKWVYNTYEQWQENFPFWSIDTIKRTILRLEKDGMIESTDKFNSDTRDRTKWYTINYECEILHDGRCNLPSSMSDADCPPQHGNLPSSTIEQRLHTDTTKENNSKPSQSAPPPERKPMPRHGMAQTLLAVLHEDVLHIPPPTNYGRAMKDADTLAKAGCTPDEIHSIAEWLINDPFWGPKGVTINRILTKRDEWLSAKANTKKKVKRFVV